MGKERSVFKNLLRKYGTIPNFNIADLPKITPEQKAAREAYKLEVVINELFGVGGREEVHTMLFITSLVFDHIHANWANAT